MKIISFAWTTQVLLDGVKTVTRRDWVDRYAMTFHKGDIVQAYDKNPRCGGKKIAKIRLTKEPYKQWLRYITDVDEVREGGIWGSGKAYQEAMGKDRELWVIEFELIKEG
ncbi:MAG: hypothetical protein PHS93_08715 [Candidatus Omnitrophica bacterium]|nr:hypothetical protein [Candidatus Omnitrophota bacterium]